MTVRDMQRDALLLAALPHVAFDGWTDSALLAGAVDAGLEPADVLRFFPGGACEAVGAFSIWADRQMIEAVAGADLSTLRHSEKIAFAVRVRLESLEPYREAVRRSIGFLALVPNVPAGLHMLYCSVDEMWYAVGDLSADFSFYTKRALLAGVVSTTTLYWLDDESDRRADSWAFLDRRLADVLKIPQLGRRAESLLLRLPNPFRLLQLARDRRRRPA
jgi:ubiquinone biosynthesis protein COQ9